MKKTGESLSESFATLSLAEKAKVFKASPEPERLMNFLIGRVMQATSGRANPQIVRTMILERLDKESDVR